MEPFAAWVAFAGLCLACFTFMGGATAWILNRVGKVNDRVGKVDTAVAVLQGKLDNGVNATLQRVEKNIGELFEKWDARDCPGHAVKLVEFDRRLTKVEE